MNTNTKHKIIVRALNNSILTFSVDDYEIKDGFVCFLDSKDNIYLKYYCPNVEIRTYGEPNKNNSSETI